MKAALRLCGYALALGGLLLPVGAGTGAVVAGAGAVVAAERLPIFDAHVHYSQEAWEEYPPRVVSRKLKAAGVDWALVSSSPDEGTIMLVDHESRRFIPELRPYRGQVGSGNWADDAATPAYLAERLKRGVGKHPYRGIGEFHLLSVEDARTPVLQAVARMAVARELVLHVHAGAEPVQALFALEPRLRILWAHAGMSTPPEEIRRMMERHANLWAEVSFRAEDILAGSGLDPTWESLLLAHPERFMIGSDTYTNSRWDEYGALIASHRAWLELMPPKAARAIAHGNALRVLGVKAGGQARRN
jgi:hypothetical protein